MHLGPRPRQKPPPHLTSSAPWAQEPQRGPPSGDCVDSDGEGSRDNHNGLKALGRSSSSRSWVTGRKRRGPLTVYGIELPFTSVGWWEDAGSHCRLGANLRRAGIHTTQETQQAGAHSLLLHSETSDKSLSLVSWDFLGELKNTCC